MQATGLRPRYFLTILAVLIIVAGTSLFLHALYLKNERLELIDQHVREAATALLDSELGTLKKINFDYGEEIISDELGESRIGKFFIIRNQNDEIIFESNSAKVLPIKEVPRSPQWVKIQTKKKFIRILNLQLPRVPDRTLQVGLVLDEDIVSPGYFSKQSLVFIVTIILIGLGVSWLSTSFLLKPISELEAFLSSLHEKSKHQSKLPAVPTKFITDKTSSSNDEFEKMVVVLDNLIDRVNKNYELSRLWAYQMAHELKTPLSILKLQMERVEKKYQINSEDRKLLSTEEQKISETINSFLAWAELENSSQQQHLFINKIEPVLTGLLARLFENSKRTIVKKLSSDFEIVANPQHLEQLLTNILSNADHYSEQNSTITIETFERSLIITDLGPGISENILARLGEPFNRGSSRNGKYSGHGLGLAWVKSICRMYDWGLDIKSSSAGTEVKINFSTGEFS